MKRSLQSIAKQLSETDIQELIRLKKLGGRKVVSLQKKRDKVAAELARIEAELAAALGEPPPSRRGRRPGTARGKAARSKKRINLSATVRDILAKTGTPMRAKDVVDALPEAGITIKDVADMRKRVSVVLASQKKYFEQVERGVYRLKES